MNIEEKLQEFKNTFLPKNFKWRIGQKEAIIEIIQTYLDKKYKVVILDSPVGSGKSILAMAIAWLLNQLNKTGYILSSDISLQEQYEKDFKKFNLNWGSIKGIDNYICLDNQEKISLSTCKIRNKNPRKMFCYNDCPYYSARQKAIDSPTSLMNYSYWMIMMNQVNIYSDIKLFPPRDFTICDEGHKILDLIQNQYSPRINENTIYKLEKLTTFFYNHSIQDHNLHLLDLKEKFHILKQKEDQLEILNILESFLSILMKYKDSINVLKEKIKREYKHESPPKEWRRNIYNGNYIVDLIMKLDSYVEVINNTSSRNIVKNPQGNDELIFNCLEESYLMNKAFHKWTGFNVLMSATFSDPKEYLKSISLGSAKYIKMNSSFDFSKSPIYFYNKRKMSYKYLEANLPWLNKKINEILENHQNQNGIIHTVSYALTLKIYNNLNKKNRKRVLIYNGTEEKRQILDQLKRNKNIILMGPSLLEGLDLKDELSRFIIFAKTPYPSIRDRFIKVKMNLNPEWYQWKTAINIIQGIGRGIRNEKDWCIVYYLDGSLGDLLHRNKSMFPKEILNRIKLK